MSLANTIKALHGRNNNTGKVFAKDKSDKKLGFWEEGGGRVANVELKKKKSFRLSFKKS